MNDEDNYVKKTDNGTYLIIINPYLSKPITYKDDTFIIQFDLFYQIYTFINKSDYSDTISYVRKNDSILCHKECPDKIDQIINRYIKAFDKEFNEIIPSKDNWMKLTEEDN